MSLPVRTLARPYSESDRSHAYRLIEIEFLPVSEDEKNLLKRRISHFVSYFMNGSLDGMSDIPRPTAY